MNLVYGGSEQRVVVGVETGLQVQYGTWSPTFLLKKYANDEAFQAGQPFAVSRFQHNTLLLEGRYEMQRLITGGSAPVAYDHDHAYIGVGAGSLPEALETQEGLQSSGGSLCWQPMDTDYPSVAGTIATYRSTFGSADANYDWQEFTLVNAANDDGRNMFRKVSNQGTKVNGQTWTLTITVELTAGS